MTNIPQTDTIPEAPQTPKPMQYFALKDGEQIGPYTLETLHELVSNGSLPANAHIWAEGMTDWMPYNQLFTDSAAKNMNHLKLIEMSRNNIIRIAVIAAVVLGFFALIFMSGDSKWDKKYKQAMTLIFETHMSKSKYPDSHAYELMEEAAEAGYAQAQLVHGFLLIDKNESQTTGFKWLKKAAEQNNVYAQQLLGYAYLEGKGTAENIEKGVKWLKKAAEKKNLEAGMLLLELYADKKAGGILDKKEATELALTLYDNGVLKDNEDIIKLLEKTKKLPDGLPRVLKWISDEKYIKESKKEEWSIARTLAEEGNAWGQYIYGKGLMDGDSSFEKREGLKYMEKAAKQKHVMAEYCLAKFYQNKKERDKASAAYRKLLDRLPLVGFELQSEAWEAWGGAVPGEKEDED